MEPWAPPAERTTKADFMVSIDARLPGRRSALMWVAWSLFSLNVLLPLILPESATLKAWFGLGAKAALVLAFWAALRLARSGEAPKAAWILWTIQLGFLLMMRAVFTFFPQWKEALPKLPWGQPGHFVSYALEIAAFLAWGSLRAPGSNRLWAILDDLLFATGGLFLVWNLGFRDFVMAHTQPRLETLILVSLLLATALSLGLWASLFLRPPPGDQGRLAWIGLGIVYALGRQALLSAAHHQHWPRLLLEVEALDAFTWLCWAQAFFTPRYMDQPRETMETRFKVVLPYLPAMLSLFLVGIYLVISPHRLDWQVVGLLMPVIILLLWRQGLVMQQFRALARSLETQVAQRTKSLEEAQAVLLQTERMNTMASIGAGLAHDLNNFIGVARLSAELLEQDLAGGQAPAVEDIQRIKDSATKAGELTSQLMAFGQQPDLPVQSFDLGLHVDSRTKLLHAVVRPPVRVVVESSTEPLPVLLDASKVDQILVNLLSNARDAMPQGGRIWVRSRRMDAFALLEVQDEGTGIPEAVRQRMFDPFFTTKSSGRGTGLGLASVKALVAQFSGSMEVETEEGKGTTFRIRFSLQADETQ